jgi:serine protease Do
MDNPLLPPVLRRAHAGDAKARRKPASAPASSSAPTATSSPTTTSSTAPTTLTVTLDDGRELTAKVIGRDPLTDIAVVKVDAKDLPAVTFADTSKIEVGDRVLAIGNPFGIGETVTSGIVSAKGRRVGILERREGL